MRHSSNDVVPLAVVTAAPTTGDLVVTGQEQAQLLLLRAVSAADAKVNAVGPGSVHQGDDASLNLWMQASETTPRPQFAECPASSAVTSPVGDRHDRPSVCAYTED